MPITETELRQANQAMLGNTNRGILFTSVNLAPEVPRLENMLAYLQAGVVTWEQFNAQVKEKLTVTSFADFVEKFQPCFYYRLRPANGGAPVEEEPAETKKPARGKKDDKADEAASDANGDFELGDLPEYEFSLEGGPVEVGWQRVVVGVDHPYVRSLQSLIKERALMSQTTFQVNVDTALFGFKPRTQQLLVRKGAQDLQAISDKLLLEMKRNADSPDTQRALEAYDRRVRDLENALGDDLRVLPTVTHGLAEARKALGAGGPSTGAQLGEYVLALGERAQVVARPSDAMQALADAGGEDGGGEMVLLADALSSRPLARRELSEISGLPEVDRFPAVVGSFMSEMVRLHKIDPILGNLVSVVLQDPRSLAAWNLNPKEVDVYHDTFLGIYSGAIQDFLGTITPLMETIMGIYMLFNEFPAGLRRGAPELIIANSELTDLWQVYPEEIATFIRGACHQAANQYQDAISFAIVPAVSAFVGEGPISPPEGYIEAGDFVNQYKSPPPPETEEDRIKLDEKIEALRKRRVEEAGAFGRVAGPGEVLGLMELGHECGFQVYFSPEERVIAGRTRAEYLEVIQDQYCPGPVVDKEWAVCGVLSLPDFVCLPPDGVLITGKVVDGREVGVEVPQVIVRSCYVAAGRMMCNDSPDVLRSTLSTVPRAQLTAHPIKVRPNTPGVGLDLTKYAVFGQTRLPIDHFLDDSIIKTLLARDQSFLVFGQVTGKSPHVAAARTLHRQITEAGERYDLVHHHRQRVYLKRLVYAAYHLGLGGAWPTTEEMNGLLEQILKYLQWYDFNKEGYANAFPSELLSDKLAAEGVDENGELTGYVFDMPFAEGVAGEMELFFI